jgi:hypothetical protein
MGATTRGGMHARWMITRGHKGKSVQAEFLQQSRGGCGAKTPDCSGSQLSSVTRLPFQSLAELEALSSATNRIAG